MTSNLEVKSTIKVEWTTDTSELSPQENEYKIEMGNDFNMKEEALDIVEELIDPNKEVSVPMNSIIKEENNKINGKLKNQCHICYHVAANKIDLKKHIDFEHLKMQEFKCTVCPYSTTKQHYLKQHFDRKHLKPNKQECILCDFSTDVEIFLRNHMKKEHEILEEECLKEHQCHLCDFSTYHKYTLVLHIDQLHLKNVSCRNCAFKTNDECDLNSEHFKKTKEATEKKINCTLCDYSSHTLKLLKRHTDVVHLKLKRWQCHFCDYSTTWKSVLTAHINVVHLDLKEFKCELCTFIAARKYLLQVHVNDVHKNLRKFKCYLCDYSSNRNYCWKRHVLTVHKNNVKEE